MIRISTYILPLLLAGISSLLYAQQETEIDTSYYNSVEPVKLELSKYPHGTIQWQESKSMEGTWEDIQGADEFSFQYSTDTSMFVRAMVLSGNCDPVYSQYSRLETLRVFTASADSITSTSAIINCEIDTGDVVLTEYGILYSTHPDVDQNSSRISFPPPVKNISGIKIENLNEGVAYYTRAFGITEDGFYIFGNVIDFSTVKVSILPYMNVTKDSVWIVYEALGADLEEIDEHGIFINNAPGSLPSSEKIIGAPYEDYLLAIAGSLSPGTHYYVQAFIRLGTTFYYSDEKKITTWSVYNDPVDTASFEINYRIEWDSPATAKKLNAEGTFGDYGRVERLGDTDTLLLVYQGGPNTGDWLNIYMRKSVDNGATWGSQETLMDLADYPGQYWRFCTPEILFLQNGWVLMAFEANARPDENESSVQILISKDSARTWEDPIIYKTGRTWEPAMVQLPNGEIELFYSSEAKWWPGDPLYQDIQVIRSTDNGITWSAPQVVAYYPYRRDGMPVPVNLQGNKGVVFAIETVGSGNSPYIIHRDVDESWELTTSDFLNSPHRWWVTGFSGHGGAPYLLQLPTGETILSAHIYRGGDWHQNNYQQVMIGDNNAKNFESLSNPWDSLPVGEGAVNNSLFLKDENTVVTISTRMFSNGTGGIYWLEGEIVPK
jgi:hypothetical protein